MRLASWMDLCGSQQVLRSVFIPWSLRVRLEDTYLPVGLLMSRVKSEHYLKVNEQSVAAEVEPEATRAASRLMLASRSRLGEDAS